MTKLINFLASDTWSTKDAAIWEEQSRNGMTYFLFTYALLIYGTILFLGITAVLFAQITLEASWLNSDKSATQMFFFNFVVCATASQVYGVLAWKVNSESYKRYLSRK